MSWEHNQAGPPYRMHWAAPRPSYEVQVQPAEGGGWQFTLTTSVDGHYWTTPPIPLQAADKDVARAEAERMVLNLANASRAAS
jgi:hypothetical protein